MKPGLCGILNEPIARDFFLRRFRQLIKVSVPSKETYADKIRREGRRREGNGAKRK